MRIECESCNAAYTISDALLSDQPIGAQCPYCGHVRIVRKTDASAAMAESALEGGLFAEGGLGGKDRPSSPSFAAPGGNLGLTSDPPPVAWADRPGARPTGRSLPPDSSLFGSGNGPSLAQSGSPRISLPPAPNSHPPPSIGEPSVRSVPQPPALCGECGTVLTDEFDKVLGLCERHQRERSGRPSSVVPDVESRPWEEREGVAAPSRGTARGREAPLARAPSGFKARRRISFATLFLGGLLLLLVAGGGYLALNPGLVSDLAARVSSGQRIEDALPPNPVRRERAKWKLDNIAGTAAEYLATARSRHFEDTWSGYQLADDAFKKAIYLDEDNASAIAGYFENLAIWKGVRLTESELELGEAAARYAAAAAPTSAAPHRAKAALAWVKGDLNGCRAAAEKALSFDPHDPRAHLLLAGSYLEGNAALAVREAELAQNKAPELRRTDRVMVRALANAGRFASAMALLEKRIAADPKNAAVLRLRGDLLRDLGEVEEAKKQYRAALATDGDRTLVRLALGETAIELGDAASAIEAYRPLVEGDDVAPKTRALALGALARLEGALGKAPRARGYAQAALSIEPREPVALLAAAEVALATGSSTTATALAKKLLEVRSGEPAALLVLARASVLEQKFEQAIQRAEEAVQNDPKDPRLHAFLGAMFLAAGGSSQAFTVMRRAAELDPLERQSRMRKGLMALPVKAMHEAMQRYREAAKEARDRSVAQSSIALIQYQLGDAAGARESLEVALEIDEANTAALLYRAQAELDRGNLKVAEDTARKLLRLDRTMPVGLLILGRALAAQAKTKEAMECYETALRADPGLTAAKIERAAVLLTQGRNADAIQILTEALQINPHLLRTRTLLRQAGA